MSRLPYDVYGEEQIKIKKNYYLAEDRDWWWGCCECGNEPSGSTKFGGFLD